MLRKALNCKSCTSAYRWRHRQWIAIRSKYRTFEFLFSIFEYRQIIHVHENKLSMVHTLYKGVNRFSL